MLSTRSDRSRLLGKTIVTLAESTSGVPIGVNLNPSTLGSRPAAYSLIFTRWRISRLIVKCLSAPANAYCTVGFLDDTISSPDVPTSEVGVLDLRCSVSLSAALATSTYNEFEWRPLRGPTTWFYTTLEGSSSDPRLEVPCSLWFAANSTGTSIFEIDYDIQFEGGCDPNAS